MTTTLRSLSNDELDREARRLAMVERQATTELLQLLIEVERRGLHLALGHSSMFAYCTRALHLSEQAAYTRITAARAAKQFPELLTMLAEGSLTLSGLDRLAPHLTNETADVLFDASRFKSTREIERMLASAFPQPDVASEIRALPTRTGGNVPPAIAVGETPLLAAEPATQPTAPNPPDDPRPLAPTPRTAPRPVIAPIAASRYLLRVTLSEDTEQKLRRVQALMRHSVPNGDLDAILNQALTLLLDRVARSKTGRARTPRSTTGSVMGKGRQIPAAVRREAWNRDGGKCGFVGSDGVCGETALLEFHHVIPFAAGGPTNVTNLQLRCRAHNAHEAAIHFGNRTHSATRRAPS